MENGREWEEARLRLVPLFSAEAFESDASQWTRTISESLRKAATERVLSWSPASESTKRMGAFLDASFSFESLAEAFTAHSNHLHSPRAMGHQVPPPLPLAALFESLGAFFNQGSGVYEIGPASNGIERAVVGKLCEKVGWTHGDGIATHGGSLANLTALLAARHAKFPQAWEDGLAGKAPAIVCSAEAHYSVARAAAVIGLGSHAVARVATDSKRRLIPERVTAELKRLREMGRETFALMASAGTTSVGAFDPLSELADVAKEAGVWLHVDGAHGASALFSKRHREKLRGIEKANSLTWDAHKMLYTPALQTYLLFREREASFYAFRQDAPYLFGSGAEKGVNGAERTLECTRRALSLSLWGVWAVKGAGVFEDCFNVTAFAARELYKLLRETSDFEALHEPEANILCFRHIPSELSQTSREFQSDFQGRLREAAVKRGNVYLTRTRLDGEIVLRVTIMNPLTSRRDLTDLMDELREVGKDLLSR